MRNPAPIILTLLLAAALSFYLFHSPDSKADTSPSDSRAAAAQPWPHAQSDISPDPKAVFGQLENGMRYIIYPNDEPPNRLSIRLHIAAGSLMEADDQRGLAHFLEHMVFNGTKNFDPDDLIPQMQRLGIAFGAHANAYTSFDETVYMLDLPEASDDLLDLGFTVMRDFADGALLEPEEIDKERGIILAEKMARDSVEYRLMQKQFSTLLPDSLVTRRFPIGTEEVIAKAPPKRLVDFYNQYYTPERMTFVAVGDIDPATIETRIRESFASLTNPEKPGPDPDLGTIPQQGDFKASVFSDPEISETSLDLITIDDFSPQPDSRESRSDRLRLKLAHAMISRRFDRIADTANSPIRSGSASRSDLFDHFTMGSLSVTVADTRWTEAVPILEQTYRRALEHGFTSAEFDEVKANLLNQLEQQVESADTRRSDSLATAIASSINDHRVLSSPETNFEIAKQALADMGPDDSHQALRDFWGDKSPQLILTTQEAGPKTAEKLKSLFESSRQSPVEAPEEAVTEPFAYTDFGPAGNIKTRTKLDDLGITQLTFENGITVNFKPTDFEKNRIQLVARIGHGELVQPDSPGLAPFTTAIVQNSGIGKHSRQDLRRLFAGRNVSLGFSVEEDHFQIAGATTPDDLKLQLQAMAAKITYPSYRSDALQKFRKSLPTLYQQLRHTLAGPMQEMRTWLRGNDPRFSLPDDPETLAGYQLEDAQKWMESSFVSAPIELNIIGDFDPETLTALLRETFGALDTRPPHQPIDPALRQISSPEPPAEKSYHYRSQVEKGRALIAWPIPGPRDNQQDFRRFRVLAKILGDRLREKIREELGASYSPQAVASGSEALDNYGFLIALSEGGPDDVEALIRATLDLAEDLASEGASADELDRTLKPMLTELKKSQRNNSYWLNNVLAGSSMTPEQFDLARNVLEDYQSITLEKINQFAAQHLTRKQALIIRMTPEKSAPESQSEPTSE